MIAVDCVTSMVNYYLETNTMNNIPKKENADFKSLLQEVTAELKAAQDAAIHIMAYMAGSRENVTANHTYRTQNYVRVLAEKLRDHPRFSSFFDDDNIIDVLSKTAVLHDIGSVGIPDRIFLKPGSLASDEFEIMKTHTTKGLNFILDVESELKIEIPFLKYAKEIIYCHHEKWDGSGYPQGLSGEDIPVSARLMALVDAYDAMISHRVYKSPMKHAQAVNIISESKGTQFDPDIADAFNEIHQKFQRIAFTYADSEIDFKKKIDYIEQAISTTP